MLSAPPPPPRGPRGSAPHARGRGRGGIQKRRADGPARVDRDGDLNMDSAASASQSRSGRGRMEPVRSARTPTGPSTRTPGARSAQSNRTSGVRLAQSGRHGAAGRGGRVSVSERSIVRGLGAQQGNLCESRITTIRPSRLQIGGLSESKAANNPDGGLASLLGFLERKASVFRDSDSNDAAVKIKKSSMVGNSVFITASPEDIEAIKKLNNFTFAGATLSIRTVDPSEQKPEEPKTAEVRAQFASVLATRYDASTKCLNLSALATDPLLQQMGAFSAKDPHKIFPAMMVVAADMFKSKEEKREAIVSVTLTDNGLADTKEVVFLAYNFPDIKNIDLSRNSLSTMKSMDAFLGFHDLENLILNNNPIESQLPNLKDDFLRRYLKLRTLNGVEVRTTEEVAAVVAVASKLPFPYVGPSFDDRGDVGKNFVTQFLNLYDTDRSTLLAQYYDSQSVYSLSVNMSAYRGEKPSVAVQPWAAYTKHSRNLDKISHLNARINRQYTGIQAIQPIWAGLPATRHPNLHTHTDKYLIECEPVSSLQDPTGQSAVGVDGLMITMHGEFEDNTSKNAEQSLRSFSRTFVLGPGAPGGPPIRVISDMLALRGWAPLPIHAPSAAVSETPQLLQPALVTAEQTELEQKTYMATQLTEQTGMTMEYSGMCLENAGWNLETAYNMFMANKANLPQEAWIGGIAR
ncbi:hypothetical protein LZ554_002578 [Drepanopeziza brunnea f. sp. 'monogermtubi']|nr:hypothetical protein LZ554_002578 [Drepanopeziza brunnea f. sp. 'monogermtubi']